MDDLALRRRRRRRPPAPERLRRVAPARRNQRWSMDFASDALWTGRRFRCLCLVDDATRESPAHLADFWPTSRSAARKSCAGSTSLLIPAPRSLDLRGRARRPPTRAR